MGGCGAAVRRREHGENISGSTSWVVRASEHDGASAQHHINQNINQNTNRSTITTSWVVRDEKSTRPSAAQLSPPPWSHGLRSITVLVPSDEHGEVKRPHSSRHTPHRVLVHSRLVPGKGVRWW